MKIEERELEQLHGQMLDACGSGVVLLDAAGCIVTWNSWLATLSDIPPERAVGAALDELFPETVGGCLNRAIEDALRREISTANISIPLEERLPFYHSRVERVAGRRFGQKVDIKALQTGAGKRYCMVEIREESNPTKWRTQGEANCSLEVMLGCFQRSGAYMQTVVDSTHEGLVSFDEKLRVKLFNTAAERMFGYQREEVVGGDIGKLIPGKARNELKRHIRKQAGNREPPDCRLDLTARRRSGNCFPLEIVITRSCLDGMCLIVAGMRDITERLDVEDRLRRMAEYDALTDLPNRALFTELLSRFLAQARRKGKLLSVLFLDLDRFKNVNDTHGHHIGDLLLKAVAGRLSACCRASDIVARLGGDEFAVIQAEVRDLDGAMLLGQKLIETINQPFNLEGHEIHTGASIGITLYPEDAEVPAQLMKNADIAMFRAKSEGRNGFCFYCTEMHAESNRWLELEGSLRRALRASEFQLHYQPQMDLRSNSVIGVEALIRWQHPQKGMISPGEFIPVAEESGLIIPIGEWVLHQACAQNREWQLRSFAQMRISVNLSAAQFQAPDLVEYVTRVLRDTGLDPSLLELEITETFLMRNAEEAISKLQELHRLGVQLSMDDFGTGYSSLSYLKRFPLHKIKVDQSFVRDIGADLDDTAIVAAVISLGHNLGLKVVGEGVETAEQLDYLRRQGCDEVQGFYLSRPVPAEQLAEYLLGSKDS